MCNSLRLTGLLVLSVVLLSGQENPKLDARYRNIPLSFEANQGQTDPQVKFLSRGQGYSLFLTDSEAVFAFQKKGKRQDVVRMQLSGAKHNPQVSGIEPLPGKANYFIGTDPTKWRSNVPTYGRVSYRDVYPGVDLVYYGNQKQLEYDFVVAPGGDIGQVKLHFTGEKRLRLSKAGDLEIAGTRGQMFLGRPVIYQNSDNGRTLIEGHFSLVAQDTVTFAVGSYDRSRTLVIDPTLTYATYLGGSGFHPPAAGDCCGDSANGIAIDLFGSAYVVGTTGSADFPVSTTAFQTVNNDAHDQLGGGAANVFISKLDPTGSALVYSTYLGGSGTYWFKDSGQAIAVDLAGNAYVTGFTGSTDFPVTDGAFQIINKAQATGGRNAFVTKLTADGSGLIYSTYLGGSGFNTGVARDGDFGTGIAIDVSGNAYVIGSSFSQDFPTTHGAFQTTNKAWPIRQTNPFVTKLNASGTSLVFSTYLGGTGVSQNCCYYFSGADYGTGITVDIFGDAFVTGFAHSKDFPVTPGAYQSVNHAHNSINGTGAVDTNNFVTKFDPTGSVLLFSTYIGGSGNPYYGDQAEAIAVDSSGFAYIAGQTGSTDYPITSGAFLTLPAPYNRPSPFATKVSQDGGSLVYSTYLGGSGNYNRGDNASGIAVNSNGEAYIVGTTISWDLPVTLDAFQSANNQSTGAGGDYYSGNAFLTQLNSAGSKMIYSSYFGGSGASDGAGGDLGLAIALDGGGDAYIAGRTVSGNLPVTGAAYQAVNRAVTAGNPGSGNAFIAEFGIGSGLPLIPTNTTLTSSQNPQVQGGSVTFKATISTVVTKLPTGNVTFKVDGTVQSIVSVNSSGHAAYSTSSLSAGSHTVTAAYSGDIVFAPSSAQVTEKINMGSVSVVFGTSPSGLTYSIDGTAYTTQKTITFTAGSTHTISTTSPQGSNGTRQVFTAWSDGGALSHTITVNSSGSYTASFNTEYLLTTQVNPASTGAVSPVSGNYYTAGTKVSLSATPSSGYVFESWTGNVANATSTSTTIAMSAPETVTASFVSSGNAALFGNITGKSGSTSARDWSIQVRNNGPGAAVGSAISGISFSQTGGASCTPSVTSALPASAGNLAPSASATVPLTISFVGCAANSRFTVTVSLTANSGSSSGSIVRQNQFQ